MPGTSYLRSLTGAGKAARQLVPPPLPYWERPPQPVSAAPATTSEVDTFEPAAPLAEHRSAPRAPAIPAQTVDFEPARSIQPLVPRPEVRTPQRDEVLPPPAGRQMPVSANPLRPPAIDSRHDVASRVNRPPQAAPSQESDPDRRFTARLEELERSLRMDRFTTRIEPAAPPVTPPPSAVEPVHAAPPATSVNAITPATGPPLQSHTRRDEPAGQTIHIGTIDVHIAAPAPKAPVRRTAPASNLARGFVASFGLRQG